MKTALGLAVIASFGIGILILQMSGLAAVLGVGGTSDYVIQEKFNDTAKQNPEAVGGDTGGSTTGIKFVVSSLSTMMGFAEMAVLLPVTFANTPLPWYAAYPLGLGVQGLVVFGVAQVASNRPWN